MTDKDRVDVYAKWVFDDIATKIGPTFSKWTGTTSIGWRKK